MPDDKVKKLSAKALENYGKSLVIPPSMITKRTNAFFLKNSEYVRDVQIWEMPILPGAVSVFQQLSATREWQVTGKVRSVSRAIDFLNEAKIVSHSGYIYTGFEEFLRRRALDYLACGRTVFTVNSGVKKPVLEYLDPVRLSFQRQNPINQPVSPSEKVWRYHNFQERYFRSSDVFLSTPIPLGATDNFVSPISFILPSAMLAWLLQEHDSAALDGRKIREILFVGSDSMQESVENAIKQLVSIYSGADPSKVGIPVVAIQNMAGVPIESQIARIGLSSIPENFDRNAFIFSFANQISAALGLPLRQFWNEESTTNRSLEEVQERRGQRKGPAAFVRSEERLINTSGILKTFGKVHFSFVEEVDSSAQKVNAEVLKLTADALGSFADVFGATLDLQAVEAWMQMIRVLPANLQILLKDDEGNVVLNEQVQQDGESDNPNQDPEGETIKRPDETPIPSGPGETVESNDESNWGDYNKKSYPDYGEVSINQDGQVVERRHKIFSLYSYLLDDELQNPSPVKQQSDTTFEASLQGVQLDNRQIFKNLEPQEIEVIRKSIEQHSYFTDVEFNEVQQLVQANVDSPLTDHQQFIIDYIVGEV